MSAIVVEDHIVHYEVLGRGRPLVLLHGWIGSWRYWIPVMQAVSHHYRAYALDLWGYGDTDHVPDQYGLDQQASLVLTFLENLGISRAAFVGHGLGGLVSARLIQKNPDLAERMMLVNVPLTPDALDPRLLNDPADSVAEWLLDTHSTDEALTLEVRKADPKALRGWTPSESSLRWYPSLESLEPSCLLVFGSQDPAIQPPSPLYVLEAGVKHHMIGFDHSGHFPMLDETSRFNRLLADFLSLPSGEPVSQLQVKTEWKRRVR